MDPKANMQEQRKIAKRIQAIYDNKDNDPVIGDDDTAELLDCASELAELSLALLEWIQKGGFVPRDF